MKPEQSFKPEEPDTVDKREKSEVEIEQSSREDIKRSLNESQASYLQRAGESVTQKMKEKEGMLFDPGRLQEKDLPQDTLDMIKEITTEALKPQEIACDLSKNEEVIENLEGRIGYHDKGDLTDSDSFDETQRSRKFFEIQPGKGAAKRETYWNTLFFPYNTEATREFAKKTLDDKKIVLLGGGRSRLNEELQENGITPREITNVDPFVENVEEGADPVIPLSASDEDFIENMREQGIDSADEIWAEYSVPAYLEDPKEIQQLIQNIDELLAEGGSARIWPLEVGGRGEDSDQTARKDSLINSLKNINATDKYEIVQYESAGRPGFTLHKLAPSKEELQKKEDQERIEEIRKELGLDSQE